MFFVQFFFVLEAQWTTLSRPSPTFVVLRWEHLLMNRMRTCRKTQVFAKSWNRFGWDFYFFVFRCKHLALEFFSFGGCTFSREQISQRGLAEWGFHFAAWNLVFQLALFCTSHVQLIKDVYNNRFWCRFKKRRFPWMFQQFSVNFLLFWNWLLDCRTFVH